MPETSTELSVQVQEPASWRRRLAITVPSERVRRTRQSVAQRIAGNIRLPGFRKGHTPASIVERQFGPAIDQETLDRVIQDAYREVLDSQGLQPINQGQVENVHYHGGDSDLSFEVEFEVSPTVELGRIHGFTVTRPAETVGDDEVDAVLEQMRQDRGTLYPVEEGSPDYGDQVLVEITQLEGEGDATEPRRYRFELGGGQAIADIEAAILTLTAGGEGEFTVHFPEDFPDEAQRGKEQRLRIRLDEIRRKQLPELDDEFARGLGDFADLAALRVRVRGDLEENARRRADQGVRDLLIQQIVDANPFELPDSMVDRYLDFMTGETDAQGRRRQAPAGAEEQISQFRSLLRPQAEASLKRMLVVDQIADREGLRATADDVDARVEQLAAQQGRSPSEVWVELERSGRLQSLEAELTEERVFEHLRTRSTITQG